MSNATNGTESLKVGDKAVQVEQWTNGSLRLDRSRTVTIVRETATTWIDDADNRYRKSDGAKMPVRLAGSRCLVSCAAFDAAKAVAS